MGKGPVNRKRELDWTESLAGGFEGEASSKAKIHPS